MLTENSSYKVSAGRSSFVLLALACVSSLFISNGIYIVLCLVTIALVLSILWRYNRPGIFVFAFIMQWLQVVTYVFWMNSRGKRMEAFSSSAPSALVVSCFGLLLMAIVIAFMINKLPTPSIDSLKQQAEKINARRLLIVYILSTVFLTSIRFFFGNAGGADQLLVVISSLKWVFFMTYGFVIWMRKKNMILFILIIGYEFATSLTSYFSSFKEVLLFTIIIALTFVTKIKARQIVYGLIIAGVLSTLLLTWTAIKSDYRKFVRQGRQEQVVTVERSEAIGKMQSEVKELTWRNYEVASNMVLYRVQYLHNLSLAMERVPYLIPYQNGGVWGANISFVITPRALFPQKGIYNASAKARTYTGLNYAGIKQGSSFSLGYFADCYVDFGYIGMFLPITLIGLFVGLIYRVFYKMESLNILFRFAIINICLYSFTSFEADGLFLFGRLLTTLIVYWVLAMTLFPKLQKWLYKKAE